MIEIDDGDGVTWRFADEAFLRSGWTCIWGRGCLGIHAVPAPHLADGCCSVGAVLDGEDEAMTISALAATIAPERFQHHAEAEVGGIFSDETRTATRVLPLLRTSTGDERWPLAPPGSCSSAGR